LNQALDFLMKEHSYIDELQAKLLGVPLIFSDYEKSILENNLFGVDLNEESVEIAKLSLWLRTAQPNRKLNDLNSNIKCGNSLIDDPTVAGDKAFNWHEEFPTIFKKKEKKIWHVTTATHNSRYSQRMFDNFVKMGEPVWLSEQEELIVTETISEIVKTDGLNIVAYNICGDHAHIIVVGAEEEIPRIIQKLKAMSARACNIAMGRTVPTEEHAPLHYDTVLSSTAEHASTGEHAPLHRGQTQHHLWASKFDQKEITTNEQYDNTIAYIQNNRKKHNLPESKALKTLISQFTCSKAHAMRKEYTGGFDVVIGNPPYVQLQSMGEMSETLKNSGYETFDKGADLYCIFTERGYNLLKKGGMQSFIMPNKWMLVAYGKPLRKFLSKTGLRQVLNFGDIQFFEGAATIVCIFVTQKSEPCNNVKVLSLNQKTYHGDFMTEVESNLYDYPNSKFGENEWSILPYNDALKLEQMKLNGTKLKDLPISINYGIKTGFNDAFFIDEETRQKLIAADAKSAELIKPMVRGRDISAYGITGFEYLICTFPSLKLDIENYPAIKEHLLSYGYDRLKQTGESGARKKTSGKWFETQDSISYHGEFAKPKIIYPNMTSVFPFMYDESGMLGNDKSFILTPQDDSVSLLFLTAVFNSSLTKLWIWHNCPELLGGTREIRKVYFEHFPVPQANQEQTATMAQYAISRAQLAAELQALSQKFQRTIQRKFPTVGHAPLLYAPLPHWYLLSYSDFIKELGKKKVKLSLSDEAEWEDYFLQEQKKALAIKHQIDTTDKEIDQMVYALYGLTEEEIRIVENN